ncbi:hypothetical protein ACVTMO_13680 [Pseudomonas segetis]
MANSSLHRTITFQLSIGIPIFLGVVSALAISQSEPSYSLCFNSSCFETWLQLYKAPLTFAALAIPLAGITAAVHRSIETQTQISLTNQQLRLTIENNTFSNYIKHRDDFIKLLRDTESIYEGKFVFGNPLRLYGILFPSNSYSGLLTTEANPAELETLTAVQKVLIDCAEIISMKRIEKSDIENFYKLIDEGHIRLGIVITDPNSVSVKYDKKDHEFIGSSLSPVENISILQIAFSRIMYFITFDPSDTKVPYTLNSMQNFCQAFVNNGFLETTNN